MAAALLTFLVLTRLSEADVAKWGFVCERHMALRFICERSTGSYADVPQFSWIANKAGICSRPTQDTIKPFLSRLAEVR